VLIRHSRIVNLATGALMIAGGILNFFSGAGLSSFIIGSYVIVFGASIGLLEFQIPPQVSRYASFLFSFLGRGIFYIFVGTILFHGWWLLYLMGGLVGLVGVLYVVLEWVPSVEPPSNMREAEAGWGAEQV
jgi:hypothetical protein